MLGVAERMKSNMDKEGGFFNPFKPLERFFSPGTCY
jgi:hypothetical protein